MTFGFISNCLNSSADSIIRELLFPVKRFSEFDKQILCFLENKYFLVIANNYKRTTVRNVVINFPQATTNQPEQYWLTNSLYAGCSERISCPYYEFKEGDTVIIQFDILVRSWFKPAYLKTITENIQIRIKCND